MEKRLVSILSVWLAFFSLCPAIGALAADGTVKTGTEKAPAAVADSKNIAALVNGEAITQDDLMVSLGLFQRQLASKGQRVPISELTGLKAKVLQRLISDMLLYQESQRQGIKVDEALIRARFEEVKKRYPSEEEFKRRLEREQVTEEALLEQSFKMKATQTLLTSRFIGKTDPTAEQIQAYYDGNPKEFEKPEEIRARHILVEVDAAGGPAARVEALNKIREIAEELKAGKDFAEVAQKNSACPSGKRGGDLGYFRRGQMVKPFEDAAFSLPVGQVSDVVETQFGFHILKVEDKKPASKYSFEQAKEPIRRMLVTRKMEELTNEYAGELMKSGKVEIMDPELRGMIPEAPPKAQ